MFGIGLVCVRKLNASCDECCAQRTKCEYPGKTNVGVGSGVGAGLPTKGQPVIVIPPPKCESLEVRCQEVAVREQANELAEACLEVDHDMVCAMHDLTCAMGCANMGVLLVAGAGGRRVCGGVGCVGGCVGGTFQGNVRGEM